MNIKQKNYGERMGEVAAQSSPSGENPRTKIII